MRASMMGEGSLVPRLLPALQHCTRKTREPGKTNHVRDVAGGTNLTWFHLKLYKSVPPTMSLARYILPGSFIFLVQH